VINRPFTVDLGGRRLLRGEARIPQGPPPRSAVVLAPGFRGSRARGFFPALSRALAGAGHAVVAFDFTGAGTGTDPERITDVDAFAANTFSREVEELKHVLGLVAGGVHLTRSPDRVGVLGFARGGSDAVLAAARPGRGRSAASAVDALVTWSTLARLDRWNPATRETWEAEGRVYVPDPRTGRQLPLEVGLLRDFEANRGRLDVVEAAGRVGVPWLLVHGTGDDLVDPDEARTLASVAGAGARLMLIEGAGHAFGTGHPFRSTPPFERALEATLRPFRRHLVEDDRG